MKVCVSATAPGLDSRVNPRFGRCECFTFVDTDTMKYESIDNPSISAPGGAGIQAAQTAADRGVEAILTGNVGPNAQNVLNAAGIIIATGISGTVREAVEAYKSGVISPATPVPDNTAQVRVGSRTQMGRGAGGCRGMGMAGGRGMGGGVGGVRNVPGSGMSPTTPLSRSTNSKKEVINELKEESTALKARLDTILKTIEELEKD